MSHHLKRSTRLLNAFKLIVFGALCFSIQAARAGCDLDVNEHTPCSTYEEEWKESNVVIPPVARESEFKVFPVPEASQKYRYYLAQNSITRGENGVMRYTVAVVSDTGARNIFYEGLRCETDEIKTYAYASNKGRFRRARNSRWRPVANKGVRIYQDFLATTVICDVNGYAWDADKARSVLLRQAGAGGLGKSFGCRDCDNDFRAND